MKYSNFTLWRLYWLNYKDRGVVLPIAIGLGLIAVLVGTIMLARSFRDQTDVLARQSVNGSESLAELGVTRSLNLINQFRAIASVNACGGNWNTSGVCTNSTSPSWFTLGDTGANLFDGVTKLAKILPPNTTTLTNADIPGCAANADNATTITNFTNQLWRDSSNSPADGQFRLLDYRYNGEDPNNADDGEGTLTIEGRIRQQGSGNTATQTGGTGITRLEVVFPVKLQPAWGLWVQQDPSDPPPTPIGGARYINADVSDSGCGKSATDINDFRKKIQSDNRSYTITPTKKFPPLPRNLSSVRPSLPLIITSGTTRLTVPDRLPDAKYAYLTSNDRSISITGTGRLLVDAPGKTVEIYLRGNLYTRTTNPSQPAIEVTRGTTLIIYLSGSSEGSIEGNSLVKNNNDTPDGLQIYHTGSGGGGWDPPKLNLFDNATLDNVFIFVPEVNFRQEGSSKITGTVWAKSWTTAGGNPQLIQGRSPAFDNLAITKYPGTPGSPPTLEDISVNKINNISSWRRCEATGNGCP